MPRKRHPKKAVEEALRYAEENGWHVEMSSGHAWGRMYCPKKNDANCRFGEFCITGVWSTPANPANHGKQIRRVVENCTGKKED
jgi:hypothetical protein